MPEQQHLVIVYGAPLTGKTAVAERISRGMHGKTALVRYDDLAHRWIVVHDVDTLAEQAMVYMQIKLLVSHYLRNGYNVVVEGTYLGDEHGEVRSFEHEIDQLPALMRAMPVTPLTVYLYTPLDVLQQRADEATGVDAKAVLRMAGVYRDRRGPGTLRFDTSVVSADQVAQTVLSITEKD